MAVTKRGKYYHMRFQIGGVKISESTKCTRLAEAKEYEKNARASFKKQRSRGTTVNDACVRWIEDGAPKSMYSHIRQMLIHMGDAPLESAVREASLMKRTMLANGLSVQTVNRRLACVRTLLNKSYNEYELIELPLASKISPMMGSEKEFAREIFLTMDQARLLLSKIENEAVKNVIIGLCATGMRRSEILSLTAADYVNGAIRLTAKTKGKKARTIPVPAWAMPAFNTLPHPVTKNTLRWFFEKARKAADMPNVRLHDLRHTFASWLISNPEIPTAVVRDLLGHSSLAVTNKYVHMRDDALRLAVDKLESLN